MNHRSPTNQLRIRLTDQTARRLLTLPPRARCRAASMMISATMDNIDLGELFAMRRELVALGNLLNQSLRLSWGGSVDESALRGVVEKLGGLLQ